MTMTKEEKNWVLVSIAIVALCAAMYLLAGCAGVPVIADRVQNGEIVQDEVTPYNIPGTDVPLWHEVQPLPTPANPVPVPHTEDSLIGAAIMDITPYGEYLWPLLILAFRRPRDNAAAAAKKALTGDLGGALTGLAATVGIEHTPVDVKVSRAAKDNLKAQRAAERRARKLDIGA